MRTRDESKEQAIREKAIEMVVKKGFDGLSMQKLAKAAGVSPATIYIYFKDRDDLIMKIGEEEAIKMADATLEGFDPDMSFDEGLRVQWLNRARYCLKNSREMHFLEQLKYSPFHEKLHKSNKRFRELMQQFVHNAINRGQLVKLPVEVYWCVAFAPLYQLVKFHMSPKLPPATEKFVLDEEVMDQTLSLVIKALKP